MFQERVTKKSELHRAATLTAAPRWLECTWRREPCGKKSCPVCSLLTEERCRLVEQEEPEEIILDLLDDLRYSVAEAFLAIVDSRHYARNHTERRAKAPVRRSPRRFAIYRRLDAWHEALHRVFDDAEYLESLWVDSSDAADVDWYAHVLLDYVHRQSMHRARLNERQLATLLASKYTRQVIATVSGLLLDRLRRLALLDCREKGALMLLLSRFATLESEFKTL